ncbi:hypothetical protein ACIGO7_04550 [Streptomyces virginiae]|uniref:D-alanyl-D-alanine carboxypeptidase n=1 Tax=Streptomyces virginiae TaxID=1961 RepID=UPI00344B3F8C
MAGESPDKSVDEETPGAAESSAERDPRLSVFRPRESEDGAVVARKGEAGADADADADADAESGGRDALREAVAAWVATTEPTASEKETPDSAGRPAASRAAGSASGEAKPAATDNGSAEVAPAGAGKPSGEAAGRAAASREAKPAAADSERTGSAGVGSAAAGKSSDEAASDSGSGSGSGSASGDSKSTAADSGRTAVFRAVQPGSAGAGKPSGEGTGRPAEAREDGSASGGSKAGAPAAEPSDSERTAGVRAGKPAAEESAAASDGRSARTGESGSGEPKAESADSERTAVFRAVKPGSAGAGKPSAEADKRPAAAREAGSASAGDGGGGPASAGSGSGSGEPKSGGVRLPKGPAAAASSKPAADEPADSERTAVFRAVKPGAGGGAAGNGSAEPKGQAADSERTAVFRVPKVDALKPDGGQKPKPPAAKPAPAPAPAPADEAADSERTAVFRAPKPEAPRPDAPKPDAPKPSTFVPLRADGGAPKAPVPPAPPAPGSAATTTERLDRGDRSERTTQQPLPPKPPLDMLADLTNNPPPPPSPLRTAVRRVKIYAPLVVLLAVILAVVQLVRPLPEPKLVMTAKSSYTFEGGMPQLPWPTEGQAYMAAAGLGTLGQSGEQKPVPIASVTKSMTAYIILRDHPIKKGEQGAMIDVDKTAETEGKKNNSTDNESTLDTVKEGDKISEYDAIAALMIPSANNIARLLARWDSGSQEAFVKKMNDTAKELGMTNTTYTDPSGLDATTVSTAEDQVKLGLKLVEIETLLDITKKPNWVDPSGKSWRNWNGLTGPSGALGIKTGTTTKAGGNLLFAAQKKIGNTNQLIVGAVLGQHKPSIIDTVLAASKQLMTATQKALDGAVVVKKGQVVGYVDDGLGGRTPVVATADVQAIGWASLTVDVKLADGGGKMPQTAKAGTEVGLLTVGEGASQVKVPVALQSDLASPGIGSKLTRIG